MNRDIDRPISCIGTRGTRMNGERQTGKQDEDTRHISRLEARRHITTARR
jgi:hypothetical protein